MDIELKPGEKPYHAKSYPLPRSHKAVLRKEIERLFQIAVSKNVNRSEWGAPTLIQPKENRTVIFLSNFRKLNKKPRRKPFSIPKIQDKLLNLEGFTYT